MYSTNKYFVSDYVSKADFILGNMRNHIESILEETGFKRIGFTYKNTKNPLLKFYYLLSYITCGLSIPKNAIVFFVYPIYPTYTKIIHRILLFRKHVYKIHFIYDLDGIRDGNRNLQKKDDHFLRTNNNYISLSKEMEDYIRKINPYAKIVNIRFHCYPAGTINTFVQRRLGKVIAFAGQLNKSSFIHQLYCIPELEFRIYGKTEIALKEYSNIFYCGFIPVASLPYKLDGSFGLVWDGDSIDSCSGSFGQYLTINLPHKISLYILAGIPVIIWDKAAAAKAILENGIGYTVSSLKDIPNLIDKITEEQYHTTLENIKKIRPRIINGQDLKTAIDQILQ